ncbi:MAG: hypothetical protein ABIH21_05820, partial [Patescibacteria group bacterium]
MAEEKQEGFNVLFLLHFYDGEKFIGQKPMWIEFADGRMLGTLLGLLAKGIHEDDFHGTEEYPTESKGFRTLRGILAEVYCNPFDLMIRKKGPKLLGG